MVGTPSDITKRKKGKEGKEKICGTLSVVNVPKTTMNKQNSNEINPKEAAIKLARRITDRQCYIEHC